MGHVAHSSTPGHRLEIKAGHLPPFHNAAARSAVWLTDPTDAVPILPLNVNHDSVFDSLASVF